jgi:hypothetical protein
MMANGYPNFPDQQQRLTHKNPWLPGLAGRRRQAELELPTLPSSKIVPKYLTSMSRTARVLRLAPERAHWGVASNEEQRHEVHVDDAIPAVPVENVSH